MLCLLQVRSEAQQIHLPPAHVNLSLLDLFFFKKNLVFSSVKDTRCSNEKKICLQQELLFNPDAVKFIHQRLLTLMALLVNMIIPSE